MGINRRQLIVSSGASAASLAIGHHFARAVGGSSFTLGVASGEPTPDGFVLWTRLASSPLAPDGQGGMADPVSVAWEVANDEGMRTVVRRGSVEADGRLAHSVHVEVAGLEPNRPYWYRFTALGEQSPIGRARTAPAPNARLDRLRFAFASCSNWQHGYFSAYRHMAEENPDLVLFLGDYIYEFTYTGGGADRVVRPHDGATATDLTGYRNRYALYRSDPDLRALHAAASCLITWGDHEVENDYADEWSQVIATPPAAFLQRRAAAYQAFYEHMPLRARAVPRNSALRLHERFRFGDLVSFSVLDGRQYRSKQPCELPTTRRGHIAPDSCTERIDPNRTLLGPEQEQWLFEGFKQSDAAWNILAQEQLVADLRQKDRLGAYGHWTDGWDGYPAARQRVLDAMVATRLVNPSVLVGLDEPRAVRLRHVETDYRAHDAWSPGGGLDGPRQAQQGCWQEPGTAGSLSCRPRILRALRAARPRAAAAGVAGGRASVRTPGEPAGRAQCARQVDRRRGDERAHPRSRAALTHG